MGENLFCDLCGVSVPLRDALQQIKIKDVVEAEACLNCASTLRQTIKNTKTETFIRMTAKPAPAEPAAPAEPEAEPVNASSKPVTAQDLLDAEGTPEKPDEAGQ